MAGQSTQFLKKIAQEFFCIKAIVISDNDGIMICQKSPQAESDKYMQTTTMLVRALNQTESNLQKTQTHNPLKIVNFYYDNYLVHLSHVKNLMITIFFTSSTNIELAKQISTQLSISFEKLNNEIPQIRSRLT